MTDEDDITFISRKALLIETNPPGGNPGMFITVLK